MYNNSTGQQTLHRTSALQQQQQIANHKAITVSNFPEQVNTETDKGIIIVINIDQIQYVPRSVILYPVNSNITSIVKKSQLGKFVSQKYEMSSLEYVKKHYKVENIVNWS